MIWTQRSFYRCCRSTGKNDITFELSPCWWTIPADSITDPPNNTPELTLSKNQNNNRTTKSRLARYDPLIILDGINQPITENWTKDNAYPYQYKIPRKKQILIIRMKKTKGNISITTSNETLASIDWHRNVRFFVTRAPKWNTSAPSKHGLRYAKWHKIVLWMITQPIIEELWTLDGAIRNFPMSQLQT